MSREAFLQWEERQELRYEFDGFAPCRHDGRHHCHAAVRLNLYFAVGNRLPGKSCRLFTSDVKVATATGFRYPDAFVTCSPVRQAALVVNDPVVVFEVLSPCIASLDLGIKNEEYRDTPSVQRYVILHQDRRQATVFERIGGDWVGGDWVGHIFSGNAVLAMPEVGIELPLADVYDGVEFEPNETAA